MSIFTNSFFSIAGQKERLTNTYEVLKQAVNPFDTNSITANVSNTTLKAGLEFVANNPYTTAAIVAVPASAPARTLISNTVATASLTTKAVATAGVLVVAPALLTSEKARTTAINTASSITPERIVKFGADAGKLVDTPSVQGLKDLVSENKGVIALGALTAAALGGTGALITGSNIANTLAVKENTRAVRSVIPAEPGSIGGLSTTSPTASKRPADVSPLIPGEPVLPNEVQRQPVRRKYKRKVNKHACDIGTRGKRFVISEC